MNPGGWKVCIIEPNKFERQIVIDILRNVGAGEIEAFGDGDTALETLEAFNANMIISAFELTPADAAAWTRRFRRNSKALNRHAAIFITSGAFSRVMAEECRLAGANALIGKPLSAKVLTATIKKVLANPRPFVEAQAYIGPCRRAGIVTAGAPKQRRQADDQQGAAREMQTLGQIVGALTAATQALVKDAAKSRACEAALRQVQAYAVNAGDGPLMRACGAFTLQIKAWRRIRNDTGRAALEGCAQGVAELASLPLHEGVRRDAVAERVCEGVAKAALQRAA